MASYLSTGCRNIDELMGGGLVLGCPHVLYGKYKNGKSILALQIACMCTRDVAHGGLGKPAVIYDTESFWNEQVFKTWYGFFRNRYPDLPAKPMIDIIQLNDVYQVAQELGFRIIIHRKESKTEPVLSFPRKTNANENEKPTKETEQRADWLEQSPLWKACEKRGYGVVIIDSFTILFKDVFESVQQNFPGRASAERVFLSGLRSLACRKDLVTLTICHESDKKPWGGESIPYYTKHILGMFEGNKLEKALYGDTEALEKSGKPYDVWKRVRMVYRFRHPFLTDGSEVPVCLELNKGFIDVLSDANMATSQVVS
jgi:archaellum biogenesis ATPase FlaH